MEASLIAFFNTYTPGRVWFNTMPDAASFDDNFIILQQVGGKTTEYVERDLVPGYKNARIQMHIWGKSYPVIAALARQIEDALKQSSFIVEFYDAPTAAEDAPLKLFGTLQQFSLWFLDP